MKAKTANYPSTPLQECFDELRQKLHEISITPNSTVTTASNPVLKQQNAVSHDETFTSESFKSEEKLTLSQGSRSLPRIYNVVTNPSVDDQGGDVWRCVTCS